jgi:hypothetical protein
MPTETWGLYLGGTLDAGMAYIKKNEELTLYSKCTTTTKRRMTCCCSPLMGTMMPGMGYY